MDIVTIKQAAEIQIKSCDSARSLEEIKIKYFGRKGIIAELTSSIPALSSEQRGIFGKQVNELKSQLLTFFSDRQKEFLHALPREKESLVDISLPGIARDLGRKHPLTLIITQICDMFERMGFMVVDGPEIESEYNNFTGLNIPLEHPSREAFDTFYLKTWVNADEKYELARMKTPEKLLLRSQTSPVQIRVMKAQKPPLAVIAPGRVYRPDAVDASHSFMFHQIEGFMVGENITFSNLKGVLEFFIKGIFGEDIQMRFRPHFFPFTEPSAEVDISCIMCRSNQKSVTRNQKERCSVCGGKGWLEILGSGMIHPNIFKNVGYNPKKYSGFAFGMGVERIAMLKYEIDDIRLFFENDLRFLKQF